MISIKDSMWIKPKKDYGDVCPIYRYTFECDKAIESATLDITAMGVYEAHINGKRVGDFIMAPGWTVYHKRHQYQTYDITHMLQASNEITVTVGKGWYRGVVIGWRDHNFWGRIPAIIAAINITSPQTDSGSPKKVQSAHARYMMARYTMHPTPTKSGNIRHIIFRL